MAARHSLNTYLLPAFLGLMALISAQVSAKAWVPYPEHLPQFDYSGHKLEQNWQRLTRGTKESFPTTEAIHRQTEAYPQLVRRTVMELRANASSLGLASNIPDQLRPQDYQQYTALLQKTWQALFEGRFQQAHDLGLKLGPLGYVPALYAQSIYAQHLAPTQQEKHELLREVIVITESLREILPDHPFLLFGNAYAKARIAEDLSMTAALATGYTKPMKKDLERLILLQPDHIYGYATLAGVHAGIIEKSGNEMIARMAYGARCEQMEKLFHQALTETPMPPVVSMEYAIALERIYGDKKNKEIEQQLDRACQQIPASAEESLDIAKAERILAERSSTSRKQKKS